MTNPETVRFESVSIESKCPVKSAPNKPANHPNVGSGLRRLCPVKLDDGSVESGPGGPPPSSTSSSPSNGPTKQKYNVYSQPIDPKNNMPVHANNLPSFNQTKELPTERKSSTILKGGGDGGETWTYPSPQMFWNSINR